MPTQLRRLCYPGYLSVAHLLKSLPGVPLERGAIMSYLSFPPGPHGETDPDENQQVIAVYEEHHRINVLDMVFFRTAHIFGVDLVSLYMWVWLGSQKTVRNISQTAKRYRWGSLFWCAECQQQVSCRGRKLVCWPGNQPITHLVALNSTCFSCTCREPSDGRGRFEDVLYFHHRTCGCMGCRACREYLHVWI
jgi:hypothetical protein